MFNKEKKIEKFKKQVDIFNRELFPNSKENYTVECINGKDLVYQIPDAIDEAVLYYTVQEQKNGDCWLDCFVLLGQKTVKKEELK